jgi:hypothetical protein
VGSKWLGVVVLLVAIGVAVAIAAASRGGEKPPKPSSPALSKQFGDDADLMRRLERKKLVGQPKAKQHQ